MKCAVAGFVLLSLLSTVVFGQTTNKKAARVQTLKICQGLPIPAGYIIVAYENSAACSHGAYVLKKDDGTPAPVATTTASRPRKVGDAVVDSVALNPPVEISTTNESAPELKGSLSPASPASNVTSSTSLDDPEEVSEGEVVRINTNLVTVPVSVLDRDGRFISDLHREQFKVLENGVEQKLAYFESTEKPFTVALLLDTSGSTFFHLWEIKEAAIKFAKQLRPQDRVLIVTFDRLVMLLTEATNDQKVVTEVIERNAITGFSTRLYDALDLVIKARLNKIDGRKAIVLFTDGVDTGSYQATYKSTLHQVEELDALIYPIQYDTTDFVDAQTRTNTTIVTTTISGRHVPAQTSSQATYGTPKASGPGTSIADYKLADQFLHQLAMKTGGRLYEANERTQLNEAFSKIAEELRHQYSLGYYPETTPQSGERREIKVRVDRADVAVRARDSYVQRVPAQK
ncbi:MAG TPA: VWA domain-containing protein [Pyrinomonadaceae bacterium]|jgi:VWFA-related protein|nr:VWA domain-containing protein [Pyrinomonadaceae bacterium]